MHIKLLGGFMRKLIQNLLLKIVNWLEPKKKEEVPRKKKLEARKELQPHINKRIEMGAIADPFGSCLAVVDNLTVSIEIMNSQFKIIDDQKRKIDKIYKKLTMAKRHFYILMSDLYAEEINGKELSEEENLIIIYKLFDNLVESGFDKSKRHIYLEEWVLNMKKDIDSSFEELMKIVVEEDIPIRPILYNSMSPDIKIKKAQPPKHKDDEDSGEDISF